MTLLLILVGLGLVAFITFSFLRGLIKLTILAAIILAAIVIGRQSGAF